MKRLDEKWFVYILRCENNALYTGITTDIKRRFTEHSEGRNGARYTRAHPPRAIVYMEVCNTRSIALKREAEIKKLSKKDKELLVSSTQDVDRN